uniref:Uncharacterized protein n=1 Tax=Chenopodium quinoa TaxID=63459 RepID=A0A803KTT7_CHEQI
MKLYKMKIRNYSDPCSVAGTLSANVVWELGELRSFLSLLKVGSNAASHIDTVLKSTHKKAKGLFGVSFIHYDTLVEIYAKDKATKDASESFVDAIEDMDQEIDKQSLNVESDEEDDAIDLLKKK